MIFPCRVHKVGNKSLFLQPISLIDSTFASKSREVKEDKREIKGDKGRKIILNYEL